MRIINHHHATPVSQIIIAKYRPIGFQIIINSFTFGMFWLFKHLYFLVLIGRLK